MKNKELLDIYSDYLISAFEATTGTGLAELLGGSISHDQLQRLLSNERFGSAELWQLVKAYVRQIQQDDGVLIIDDSSAEKPYTDENDIIGWHYDHSKVSSYFGNAPLLFAPRFKVIFFNTRPTVFMGHSLLDNHQFHQLVG